MFKPAVRTQAKIKIALTGPSGSGKTLGSLLIAKGLVPGGRIALIDTENESASLYSTVTPFDTAPISAPYSTEKYIQAIRGAEAAGYDVLVIDSATHEWSGEGGILQQKEQIDQRGGNSYTNWAKVTPKHEAFLAAILHSKIHVIATMRSKQDYVMQTNGNGKQAPVKVGLAPVQRDGMEYEFTTVLDAAMNHEVQASKDRTGLFAVDKPFKITEDTGAMLRQWLESGAAAVVPEETHVLDSEPMSDEEMAEAQAKADADLARKELVAIAKARKWTNQNVKDFIKLVFDVDSSANLHAFELAIIRTAIETMTAHDALEHARLNANPA